jgi:hypothetical protein
MKTINQSNWEQACCEVRSAELLAIEGGASPSESELLALYRQSFLNHGIFYTVQAEHCLNNGY